MKNVVIPYPEELPGLLHISEADLAQEMRFLIAAKFYELGKLSSGKAAQVCEMSRIDFLQKLSQYDISAFNLDADQLEAEITSAKGLVL
ncbi:MAG: UPF0175 family protein [bacterium]